MCTAEHSRNSVFVNLGQGGASPIELTFDRTWTKTHELTLRPCPFSAIQFPALLTLFFSFQVGSWKHSLESPSPVSDSEIEPFLFLGKCYKLQRSMKMQWHI